MSDPFAELALLDRVAALERERDELRALIAQLRDAKQDTREDLPVRRAKAARTSALVADRTPRVPIERRR